MECKWLWVVVVAFLLGGWCECEGCWEQEKTALLQLKPFFTHIENVDNYWVEGKQSSNCCEWKGVECNISTGRVIRLFLNQTYTHRYTYTYTFINTSESDLVYTTYRGEFYFDHVRSIDYWYLNASLFLPFEKLKSLYLGGNSIAGCVDNECFERLSLKLDNLEMLDLSNNYFNNNILASLSELSSLKSLYLANNQFTGSNSTEGIKMLSKLNKLEILDLHDNILRNNILLYLHDFTSLKYLRLQNCGLKGTVDMLEFNKLMNLKELYLGENEIESLGSLFQSKGELRLARLEVLGLSNNLFNNSIFSSLSALTNLKSLYIRSNQLEGSIHIKELNALNNLEELYMFGNQVNGFVPSQDNETELKVINLKVLELETNSFNSILSSLRKLSNLKSLFLKGDNLEGSIDLRGLNALSNLEKLFMSCYNYEGTGTTPCNLPLQSLEIFPSLKSLYLGGFNFTGTRTTQNNETELKLINLEVLGLTGTFFKSNILSSLRRLSNLKSLSLYGNNLEGSIDLRGLDALSNLEELSMSCNSYEGTTPCNLPLQSLEIFPLLKTLYLIGFNFTGTRTTQNNETELRLINLEGLYLSRTFFNSNILSSFRRLSNLKSLYLKGNLEGSIDLRVLDALSNLEVLSISCDNYEGTTPCSLPLQSLGIFSSLKTLLLGGFSFNETRTTQKWQNLTSLKELQLEHSSLSSNFFQDIETQTSLKKLFMWDCEFNGSFNLHGPLHLKNLESLIISEVTLESTFLQKIGAIPSLNVLVLWDCGLNGTLHTQGLCEMTNLQELNIVNNNLKGNLPDCFSNLASLERLDLSSNQFSGNISILKNLKSLRELSLSNNNFEIPSSLGPLFNLSKLKNIYADNNTIYAETEMHSLAPTFQLKSVSLSCCGDVGFFPQFLYHQHDLRDVDLSNIYFKEEHFPFWLLENNTKLYTLVLSNNSLWGHFELPFLSHTDLSELDISKNSLYGNIPNEIGAKLPSLWSLNMSNNNFGGSIPVSIGDMNSLSILDLSNNKLTGGVSEHLAMGCSSLNVLILSNNRLQGQMFSSNFSLTQLTQLRLDGNHFSGGIPDCLSNCSFLSTLDVSNNTLFGDIPRWMGNMSSLEEIVMANNHLEGPIPGEFCKLNLKLKFLDLSVNKISGSLPSCFSPLWISQVRLSRNKLRGPLTNAFHNSTILVTLDLSNNHLTGNIPNWIGSLSQLSYLLLNNNHFEGGIPVQLCKLGHLSLIDLSKNNLSGTIPPCLKITTLNDISQDYVRYVAAVTQANSSFSTDEPIEFTTKNISYSYKGRVLTLLSGIDLSCNKLTGEIPHEFKNLSKIHVLNLSHNSLTGPIPPAISVLGQIESLDLSYNNLCGKIPSQLVGLNYLSFFSVAYNNLSGRTPEMTFQFATFDETSYLGNRFLCGPPLPNNCSLDGPPSPVPKASTDNGSIDMNVFYVSFVVSYVMVLLCIASVLYINPYWRRAWFYHIEVGITSCYYLMVDNILPKRFHCGNM